MVTSFTYFRQKMKNLLLMDLRRDLPCVLRARDWRYAYRILTLYHNETCSVDLHKSMVLANHGMMGPHIRNHTVSSETTMALKGLIDQYGWPRISRVGLRAARAAWMIVQHSDHDHLFQRCYLDFMREALREGDVDPRDLAYLVDRIAVAEGRKQIYGTQLFDIRCDSILAQVTGESLVEVIRCRQRSICPRLPIQPLPIRDIQTVDERRRSVGLAPLAEYIQKVNRCSLLS